MNNSLISIILVNWNTKQLLLQCLESIYKDCKHLNVEIIVSDNASTDGSAEAVETNYPEVRLIKNRTNLGFALGNNVAIKKAKGEYICLVNTDVEVTGNCFPQLIHFMDANPKCGIVGPKVLNGDNSHQISTRRDLTLLGTLARTFWLDYIFPGITFYPINKIQSVDVLGGCFWVIRRRALEQVGLLDDTFFFYGEDRDYCKRMRNNGWTIIYYPMAQIYHYQGSSSSKKDPFRYYLLLENASLLYWKKHCPNFTYSLYVFLRVLYHFLRITSNGFIFFLSFGKVGRAKIKSLRSWYCIQKLLKNEDTLPEISVASNIP